MTDEERYRKALERIASSEAFWVASSDIDPECHLRMFYAQGVLDGVDDPEAFAEARVYAINRRYREIKDHVNATMKQVAERKGKSE